MEERIELMLRKIQFAAVVMLGCFLTAGLGGCAAWSNYQQSALNFNYPHAYAETLTQSPHEHYQRVSASAAMDVRALVEDIDLLFLTERPTRLTRWHDK